MGTVRVVLFTYVFGEGGRGGGGRALVASKSRHLISFAAGFDQTDIFSRKVMHNIELIENYFSLL